MSLDVRLLEQEEKIFIREDGKKKEITREEWDNRFPGQKPITTLDGEQVVFTANITHNLNKMADKAGMYEALWRPEEIRAKHAYAIIPILQKGLRVLKETPEWFKKFNPANGWGDYEGLVSFVEKYLEACEQYPDAEIVVSR